MSIERLFVFDADGTLRRSTVEGKPCPNAPGESEIVPWAAEKLASFDWTRSGFGIASNQSGVAKGYMSERTAHGMLYELARSITGVSWRRDVVRMCPHPSTGGCVCRKPSPLMLFEIVAAYGADRSDAIYVGDLETDAETARAAGIEFAWAWDFFERSRGEWIAFTSERSKIL